MCGRFVTPEQRAYEAYISYIPKNPFQDIDPYTYRPNYNTAPTSLVPVALTSGDGTTRLTLARWGLIPFWWKQEKLPPLTFNARSEEAATKPMWRNSLRSQRCLMLAAGWYEWRESEKVKSETGKIVNQPYYIQAPGEDVIAFAGLWSTWTKPDGDQILSCAVLTQDAAPAITEIHHRMPAVLQPEQFEEWIDPATSLDSVHRIIANARQDLAGHRVSTKVNSVRNMDSAMINPL